MVEALFLGTFFLLVFLRLPIAFSLAISSVVWVVGNGTPLTVVPQVMTAAFDSFVLLAIPLFMLAGALMNSGGITERLFGFASSLVGHVKGGLGHVNVVASVVFAGMSGSAVADSAGLGQLEIAAMRKEGFDPEFSAAITAASSTIGPIIPPSIPLVIYGMTATTSIGALFLGGVIPGLVMAAMLMLGVYLIAGKRKYPVRPRATMAQVGRSFASALLPLMTPAIIIGGIATGMFTPTEAAAVAVLYAFVLGTFVYREMKLGDLLPILISVTRLSAAILIILSAASLFSYVLTFSGLAGAVTKGLLGLTTDKHLMLLIILSEEGAWVTLGTYHASFSARPYVFDKPITGRFGTPIPPVVLAEGRRFDIRPLQELQAQDFDAIVIPGGFSPDILRRDQKNLAFVRDFHEQGKPIAAICHGPWLLISAGIARGRTLTCFMSIKDDVINAGAHYVDEPVVVDGNIITSRMPDDLPDFCRATIFALESR